jgi:hypothetical protein
MLQSIPATLLAAKLASLRTHPPRLSRLQMDRDDSGVNVRFLDQGGKVALFSLSEDSASCREKGRPANCPGAGRKTQARPGASSQGDTGAV